MINPDLTVAQAHAAIQQFQLWLVEDRGYEDATVVWVEFPREGFKALVHALEPWTAASGQREHDRHYLTFDEAGAPVYPHVRSKRERELRRLSKQIAPLIEDADAGRYVTELAREFVEDLKGKRDEIAGLLTAEAA